MELAVLSPPYHLDNECQTVNRLFEAGLNRYHVRKPGWTEKRYRNYLNKIDREFHSGILIHAHFQLCSAYELYGIHIGKRMRNHTLSTALKMQWFKLRYPSMVRSTTITHPIELPKTARHFDEVYLSPVFGTASSESAHRSWGLGGLKTALEHCAVPVFALGGIDRNNAERAAAFGFAGVAMISSIWKNENPAGELSHIRQILNPVEMPLYKVSG